MPPPRPLALLLLLLALPLPGPSLASSASSVYHVSLEVAPSRPLRDLPAFWSSTGFSAPSAAEAHDYLLSAEMEWNLAYIGAMPRAAVRQVRAHWPLQLVRARRLSSDGDWQWDFADLDRFLDRLVQAGLEPCFEIMGSPVVVEDAANAKAAERELVRPLFANIAQQAKLWEQLVFDTVRHLVGRYGLTKVSSWRFETWNEPDLTMYNVFNWTVTEYMTYFTATVRGIRNARSTLGSHFKLGGPAGTFKSRAKHPICWHVLDHCNQLEALNLSCGLDFISLHRKGDGSSRSVVEGTLQLLGQLLSTFPHLRHLPFANDEADPLTGWWRREDWRGDRRYAGMIVNTVADLQGRWRGDASLPDLELISNDNGFLETTDGHFQQRTLLASFHSGDSRGPFHMFRKSAMTATAMLAFLTGSQLHTQTSSQPAVDAPTRLSVLAARDDGDGRDGSVISVLVAFNNESNPTAPTTARVQLSVLSPGAVVGAAGASVLVRVASLAEDPAQAWRAAGSPSQPPPAVRHAMRAAEAPRIEQSYTVQLAGDDSSLKVPFSVPLGSISLVQIFAPTEATPLQVTMLRAKNVTFNEVVLLWWDNHLQSRHVVSYQVSFRPERSQPFTVIGPASGASVAATDPAGSPWMLFPSFHYAPEAGSEADELTRGEYRVAAVDVWGRIGPTASLVYPARD